MFLSMSDMLFQPLHNLQSRLILQRNYPNYRVYGGILNALSKHRSSIGELYQGASVFIPINMIRIAMVTLFGMDTQQGLVMQFCTSHLLMFPLLTAQRRLEVQSNWVNTMAPRRYSCSLELIKRCVTHLPKYGRTKAIEACTKASWATA
jgi:hypothetical protein